MKKVFKFILRIPEFIATGIVNFYKVCISPLLPHSCKFTPSCSTYAIQSLQHWGAIKGSWLAIKRIFRCNPWSTPKLDPVPYNLKGDFKWVI